MGRFGFSHFSTGVIIIITIIPIINTITPSSHHNHHTISHHHHHHDTERERQTALHIAAEKSFCDGVKLLLTYKVFVIIIIFVIVVIIIIVISHRHRYHHQCWDHVTASICFSHIYDVTEVCQWHSHSFYPSSQKSLLNLTMMMMIFQTYNVFNRLSLT